MRKEVCQDAPAVHVQRSIGSSLACNAALCAYGLFLRSAVRTVGPH